MKLNIESYGVLCHLRVFLINGQKADEDEFVDKFDRNPGGAEPYGCGDMRATPIPATDEVLKKYAISNEEYEEVAERVAEELSFGTCGWCV